MIERMARDFISSRVRELPASPTIGVAREAQRLRQQGVDVVDFGVGEPDFDTPWHVREAAIQALRDGFTHYPPGRGTPDLLLAIARKLERENDLKYDPLTDIIVTPGAKQAVVETIITAVSSEDEVIVFHPGWGSYEAIVMLAGAIPRHVQLESDFSINPERLNAAINDRTRMIVVGSPGNPTGHILSAEELELLADTCREHDLLILFDEIYEQIAYDGTRPRSVATLPGMWERTITVNGLSKAYAMTGWRLGYAAAPKSFIAQMLKVHEQTVTSAASFSQVGAVAALNGPREPIQEMIQEFGRRREIVVTGLNQIAGIHCSRPDGAFYAFPDISGTGYTGTELASHLLQKGVALTPGSGFGEQWDTHVRISYATSQERILAGLERMRASLSR
jgi:aspartate aminotransferase